jgi:D-alanine-D-alanine ligase-like ATP-grasp enzyme
MPEATKKIVGIIRGGRGKNYETSLIRGGDIIAFLNENLPHKYKPVDILIDKEGVWHVNGLPVLPADLKHKVNIVWNTAHPEHALDLDNLAIPNVGESMFSSAITNSKEMLREHMKKIGVKMPRTIILPQYQEDFDGPKEEYSSKKAREIHSKFSAPWIVRSLNPDKTMGIHVAKTFPELIGSIEDGVNHNQSLVVEEFVDGIATSIHSVPDFRGTDIYIFPPKNLAGEKKEKLMGLVRDLHHHLNVKHYLKSDFIIHPRMGTYLTNVEFSPNLAPGSHFHDSCESVGAKAHHVLEHLLERALP